MKLQKPVPIESLNPKFVDIMNDIDKQLNMNGTNKKYADLLSTILLEGDVLETRNHSCYSYTDSYTVTFDKTPLVTVRKTAWKFALTEMEWFLSGEAKVPEKLSKWWIGQTNEVGEYQRGYSQQLRDYTSYNGEDRFGFDQIEFLIEALKNHPNSRRLITTTWHPEEMASITSINNNPNTPSCCHGSLVQYYVRNGKLKMTVFARSQDVLLGTVHNWIQYWAYLTWLAHRTGYEVGAMTWIFGDAHIYDHPSHVDTARDIIAHSINGYDDGITLEYNPTSEEFKASDFTIKNVPEPIVKSKPQLF
jgi:thymidylate synthase